MKKVLVVFYTQSGQLRSIVEQLMSPLGCDNQVQVDYLEIKMKKAFSFPWEKEAFFDAFPESFQQIPADIDAPDEQVLHQKYDLVVLAYQVWYLSPSIPMNSFLKSRYAQTILRDTPVVTVSGSRNMWIMAQEKVKVLLKQQQAQLVGNIALVDRAINLVSVISLVNWMFTGEKKRLWGILPLPGVSEKEIQDSKKFGAIILKYLKSDRFDGLQKELVENKAVEVRHFLVSMDKKANKMFTLWSSMIIKKTPKSRKRWLKVFNYYLFFAIWVLSPIVHLIHLILYPLFYFKIKRDEQYYKGIQ
ncbi:dialkylrecorsinol condensing enzyme DarA [Flavobacterium sp. HSC-61S13]|uniref:dialkylrecorsinol condensing enzyme DarA n=1 Tax=Flavobacterium sp. HSC-61S13 TaxID=2910963 RepID=UPI00209DDE9B|nr:dialkylrecorsinol condensing enzyme DarA [Flavobacterium sp. HSC-61S13]MCP1996348.1 menaquinone-dependent protoporphyrinogen IX oxidase [Flavobacterium sp. HSC-61S13]